MVAEDDPDDRFLLQTAFDEMGYKDTLVFVENGVDLFIALNDMSVGADGIFPNFILLDMNMPKKDGYETLRELKQHPLYKCIPVIVYTTTRNEADIRRCYESGANTYIVKPVRFEMLLEVVENIRRYWLNTAVAPHYQLHW